MSYTNDSFETNIGLEAIKIELNAESIADNQLERNSTESIIARENVRISDFVCLASQFGILEAVLSSNILQSGDSKFNQVLRFLNTTTKLIGESPAFDPNVYNSLVFQLRSISENNSEIDNVERLLSTLFQELGIIAREERLNEYQRSVCIQVFERESSRAKYWLSQIIEETIDFPRYQLLFKTHQRSRPFGTSTEESGFRHVQIQFFPSNLETRDFFLLSFKFFHEYFSHFYTCKFDYPYKIDLRFKDGWLFHTIEDFCLKNLDTLLDTGTLNGYIFMSLRHLRHPISTHIQDYMNTNIRGLKKPFYEETELSNGHNLATDFLNFLTQCLCLSNENDGERRARYLYYRFSWDLIRHSPSDRFSQRDFIDRLGVQLKYLQKSHPTLLTRDIIIENITIGEDNRERIDIGRIWDILSSDLTFKNIDELMADPF